METIQKHEIHIVPPGIIANAAAAALIALALWGAVEAVSAIRAYHYIGSGQTAGNTINVSGDGEVFAVPDVAEFTVTISEDAKQVADAQKTATTKANDVIAYLKTQGIADTDVKTTDYSVQPKYEWQNGICSNAGYCPQGKSVLTGYTVSQTLDVKVRKTDTAGAILAGVGSRGVSNVSGLNFTVADQNLLEAQARGKAIADARAKADALANDLGVSIVRIVGYSENSGGPIMYAKAMAMDSAAGMGAVPPAPELPAGQNKITSNVSVTYEIR